MRKSDLRTGMICVSREGRRYLFLQNMYEGDGVLLRVTEEGGWSPIKEYNDNLKHRHKGLDIVEVYKPTHPAGMYAVKRSGFDGVKQHLKLIYDETDDSIIYSSSNEYDALNED